MSSTGRGYYSVIQWLDIFLIAQDNEYFNLGRLTSMSIAQGGNGLPFFANPVYQYICTGKFEDVTIDTVDRVLKKV